MRRLVTLTQGNPIEKAALVDWTMSLGGGMAGNSKVDASELACSCSSTAGEVEPFVGRVLEHFHWPATRAEE